MQPIGGCGVSYRLWRWCCSIIFAVLLCTFPNVSLAQSILRGLGDLDGDGEVTVLDLVLLINHLNAQSAGSPTNDLLPRLLLGYADVNGDGYLNEKDVDRLADAILGIAITTQPKPLVSEPASGSSEVGVTVRPKVIFPKPIMPSTLNSNNFYASFAGRKLPARIVPANDGSFAWLFFETNMPNACQVQVTVDGATISVASGEILDADADSLPGGIFKFNFSTVSVTPIPGTAVSSRIVDPGPDLIPRTSDDVAPGANGFDYLLPTAGVKVYVLGLEANVTYTDSYGRFTLTNMPVGDVKVVLDGRTATNPPLGYYFPEMVMDTKFEPGITNGVMTIRGDNGNEMRDANGVPIRALAMYLPRIASNVLQTVSATNSTTITLSSNAAYNLPAEQQQFLKLEVQSNSFVGMDGQALSSAQIGVSVVPAELVKDMLPPGLLQHTFDITIQAPGISTFATPASMTFPNVFNAPPGTKLNFLSFDHTTGRLVIDGTATVSEDGLSVRTDSGTGVTHPGWHGLAPPGVNVGPGSGGSDGDSGANGSGTSGDNNSGGDDGNGGGDGSDVDGDDGDGNDECQPGTVVIINYVASNMVGLNGTAIEIDSDFRGAMDSVNGYAIANRVKVLVTHSLRRNPSHVPGAIVPPARRSNHLVGHAIDFNILYGPNFGSLCNARSGCLANPPPEVHDFLNAVRSDPTLRYGGDFSTPDVVHIDDGLNTNHPDTWEAKYECINDRGSGNNIRFRAGIKRSARLVAQRELHFFAIEDLDSGETLVRGITSETGRIPSAFLPANSTFALHIIQPSTLKVGTSIFETPNSGFGIRFSRTVIFDSQLSDSDGDGLAYLAEFILGTDPNNPDTDGDGINDLPEIQQGSDPSSGRPTATGILASLPLPGEASEVVLEGSLLNSGQQTAYVALGPRGLGIVNASQFRTPIVLSQLDLPGDATDVAVDSNLKVAVVAANAGGLHFINVADPMNPVLLRTISVSANHVEVIAGIAYVATGTQINSYDVATSQLLQTLPLAGGNIRGIANEGLFLYTLDENRLLRVIDASDGAMTLRGSVTLSAGEGRVFVGNRVAYVGAEGASPGGFVTADVADPDHPSILSGIDANNLGGRAVVANGSGLAVAVGTIGFGGGGAVLDVLDVSDPINTAGFRTRYAMPTSPLSVAIGSGIAFVADGTAGLQVVNYVSFDNKGISPAISLTTSFTMLNSTNGVAEEGKLARIAGICSDDVQVRDVEFYIDGLKVATDVSFPFEYRFLTPTISAAKTNFIVRAKATDTGGNFTWSEEIIVTLVRDITPPRLRSISLVNGTVTNSVENIFLFFNEPIDTASLGGTNGFLISAGRDNRLGTSDDTVLTNVFLSFRDGLNAAVFSFSPALTPGVYRLVLGANIQDLAGNPFGTNLFIDFALLPGGPDGDEDNDGLTNSDELRFGTNPFSRDSDGDGWTDGAEVDEGSDPNDPASRPRFTLVSGPTISAYLPSLATIGLEGTPLVIGRPDSTVYLPSLETSGAVGTGVIIGRPSPTLYVPSSATVGAEGVPVVIGQPAA